MNDLTLEDLCELVVDCKNRTPPEVAPGERSVGFSIGTPHIINGRIRLSEAKAVSRETFDIWTARAIPQEGDIVLTREAPVGRVGRVEAGMNICLGQRTMLLRPKKCSADSRFLHYFLLSPAVQELLHAQASGSTVAHLRVAQVRGLKIPSVPDVDEQRRIGAALGALDDKIAVNERVAATALNLAEALYIRAADSPAWRSVKLGDAARWMSGGTPKTSEPSYWGGVIPWISALSLKSPWIDTSDRNVTELGAASGTRLVPADTVLFVVRGSSLKEEFRIGITQREVAFGQDCKALIARSDIDSHALFHGVRSQTASVLEMVDETSIGAGRLSTDLISALEIKVPNEPHDPTVTQVRKLDLLAAARQQENRTLAALRGTLLSQLMSGRLRVKDAEKIVEDHT
ncbi:restriction endonuclease subunit S [Streptomyces mirabilis]|uniref:restriction endonuclease subunit S n=1 Tax=Streptomyces sp. NPDC005388 TaxID=3156717 RepID=UPI0033A85091